MHLIRLEGGGFACEVVSTYRLQYVSFRSGWISDPPFSERRCRPCNHFMCSTSESPSFLFVPPCSLEQLDSDLAETRLVGDERPGRCTSAAFGMGTQENCQNHYSCFTMGWQNSRRRRECHTLPHASLSKPARLTKELGRVPACE